MKTETPFDPSILPQIAMRTETREFTAIGGHTFSKTFAMPELLSDLDSRYRAERANRFIETYVTGGKPLMDGTRPVPIEQQLCWEIAGMMDGEAATGTFARWSFEQWAYLSHRDPKTYLVVVAFFNELRDASAPPEWKNPDEGEADRPNA